ncbi:MAG: hypothetical protein SFU27_09585 [Thermonemataceae bacterium]|nr:hypothetical protein [Thermonemataceae bacterium]
MPENKENNNENALQKVSVFFDMFEEVLQKQNKQVEVKITEEIRTIKDSLDKEESKILEKLEPVLEKKIENVKAELQKLNNISVIIKKEIRESQPEMIDALYPIIGKLIQKYLKVEFEKINENINKQLDNTFSWEAIKRDALSLVGIKSKELILAKATERSIDEVFVIYQNSGILQAHYSKQDVVDDDMIAGMLTAIKSFVNDAFRNDAELDSIEYGKFKILIFNAVRFFLVAVVSGVVDKNFEKKVQKYLEFFYEQQLSNATDEEIAEKDLNSVLKTHIEGFQNFGMINEKINDYKQKNNIDWKFWRW